jgi:hypothetical protein
LTEEKWKPFLSAIKTTRFADRLSHLSPDQSTALYGYGLASELKPWEKPSAFIHMWLLRELKDRPPPRDKRSRLIGHAIPKNAWFDRSYLMGINQPTIIQTQRSVFKGDYCRPYDLDTAYFQFELPRRLQLAQSFKTPDGKWHCWRTLLMGDRLSLDVLEPAVRLLSDVKGGFDLSKAGNLSADEFTRLREDAILPDQVQSDGVLFIGDAKQAEASGRILVERCKLANVTLDTTDTTPVQTTTFNGIHLNFKDKTVCVGQKAHKKLLASAEHASKFGFSARHLRSHVGMLQYSGLVLQYPKHKCFWIYRYLAALFAVDTVPLDLRLIIPDPVQKELDQWTEHAIANTPVVPEFSDAPHHFLFTDASSYGVGYISVSTINGNVRCGSIPWHKTYFSYAHSTVNELLAPSVACEALFPSYTTDHIHVVSDNMATVRAIQRDRSNTIRVHAALNFLHSVIPSAKLSTSFLEGMSHPCDSGSRGRALNDTDVENLAREAGVLAVRFGIPEVVIKEGILAQAVPTLFRESLKTEGKYTTTQTKMAG